MSEDKVPLDKVQKAWDKVFGEETKIEPAGVIPVFDGDWRFFRNYAVVTAESDPAQVEKLRQNTLELVSAFDRTLPQLEALGIRVKTLLNKTIKTQADVEAWADSIFNVGPSKRYFSLKTPRSPREPSKAHRSPTGTNGAVRPRGRPRKDGLVPGSPEAREADRLKKEAAVAARAAAKQEALAPSEWGPSNEIKPRRVLARVGAVST